MYGIRTTDLYIELFKPKRGQFDLSYFPYLENTNRKNFLQKKFVVPEIRENNDFFNISKVNFENKFNSLPDNIKLLKPELKFKLNNILWV